jgi:hypothetical protein
MTKAEIRLNLILKFNGALDLCEKYYDWIMFPETEAERLEKERIEQEQKEQENQPIEPTADELNKLRIEEYIRKQKEKNQIIPRT